MKPKFRRFGLSSLIVLSLACTIGASHAANIYWDTNGATAGSGNADGAWSASSTNWTTDSTGASATSAWTGAANVAVFAAGTDFIGTHAIAVTGAQAVAGLTVQAPASGTTLLTLSGGSLAFGAATGVIDTSALGNLSTTTNGHIVTINSPLTGSAGVTLNANGSLALAPSGAARLTLGGNNTGLAGGITVTGGEVDAANSFAFGSNTLTFTAGSFVDASHSVKLSNNMVLPSGTTLFRTYGSTITTLGGVISGPGGITHTDLGSLMLTGANTYAGQTIINNGVVLVPSIGNVAATSGPLGGPNGNTTNGTIVIQNNSGATLNYVGAGETTDRIVSVPTNAGGTIAANGSGVLTFGNAISMPANALITLTGGGRASVPGITGNTALINVAKTQPGSWTITGDIKPLGGAIRAQGGTLIFSSTATTTGAAIMTGAGNRTAGGTMKFASGSSIIISSANVNGILGGWAVFNETDWAQANGSSTAISAYTGYTTDTWSSANNVDVTAAGANPASGSVANSLRFAAAGAKTLTLAGTNAVLSGGILETAAVGANTTTITGGTLITGNQNKVVGDIVVSQNNTAGQMTIASVIANSTFSQNGTFTTTAKTVTGLTDTSMLYVGMAVSGTGIAASSTISSIDSATQVTLNNTPSAAGTVTAVVFTGVNALTKSGPGALLLSGANTYTGGTYVNEGTVTTSTAGTSQNFYVANSAKLQVGFSAPQNYNLGVTVYGAGTASTNGLYLNGGTSSTIEGNGGLTFSAAPTTVRTYGTGSASLSGYDSGNYCLLVNREASGSAFASTVNFTPGSFGYRMNVLAGANTLTGDVIVNGLFTGSGGSQVKNGISTFYYKWGAGSMLLNAASSASTGYWVEAGSLILGVDNAWLPTSNGIALGDTTTTARLVLNGHAQTLADLATNSSPGSSVVGGSPTLSTLTLGYAGTTRVFDGIIGGTAPDDNNLKLVKTGIGLLTVANANNSFTGGTTITAGTLSLNSANALGTSGTILLNGGTLQFGSSGTATDYTATGRIKLADGIVGSVDTNGQAVTFSGALTPDTLGTGGLNKIGAGTLTLTGNNAYGGITQITAGTLNLDYSAADSSKLPDAGVLTMNGGALLLTGGSHVEVVGSTSVTANSTISRASGTAKIALGNITHTGTATLDIAAGGIATTTLAATSSGKLPSWITVAGAAAAKDGSGNIVAYTGYSDVVRLGGLLPNLASTSVRIVDGGTSGPITPAVAGGTSVFSIQQLATSGPATISMGSDLLRLGIDPSDPVISIPTGAGALVITGGSLTAGTDNTSAATMIIDSEALVTLNTAIVNNGTGATGILKRGSADLILSGANNFTGGITQNSGNVFFNSSGTIGNHTLGAGSFDNTSGSAVALTGSQTWNIDPVFTGTNPLSFSGGSVLAANRAIAVNGSTLSYGGAVSGAFSLTKNGPGTLVLSGANTYSGGTSVVAGILQVDGNSGGKVYTVGAAGTLRLGYSTGDSVYSYGITLNGAGTAATTGLYLNGGSIYNLQSTLALTTAPTTVRGYGTGAAMLAGWDNQGTHLSVSTAASGSVIDSNVSFKTGSFGYVMNIAAGASTATGDITFQGPLTGAVNGNNGSFIKNGAGSLALTGAGTNSAPLDIRAGSVILSGGDNRIGGGAIVNLGNGTNSGKLVINGISQTLAGVTTSGTGTANAIVAGGATTGTLVINGSGTFPATVTLGGAGTNENNLRFVKLGSGALTLAGANTYTGGTMITAGTLTLGSAGAVGTTGQIVVGDTNTGGATLKFSAANTTDFTATNRLEMADFQIAAFDTNGQNVTFSSAIIQQGAGFGGLNKLGLGTLTLQGTNVWSNTTQITAGTLNLDYTTVDDSKISDFSTLILAGGTLQLTGGTHVELVSSTTVSGTATITRSSGSAKINLGLISRSGLGTLDIAAGNIAMTDLGNDASGKLPAWITVAGGTAANDGAGNIIAYSGFTDIVRLGGKIPNDDTAVARIVNGGTSGPVTLATTGSPTTINTLVQAATAGPVTISLGTDTLRVGLDSAITAPSGAGALTITGGALTAGGADFTPSDLAIDAVPTVTVASAITNNGSSVVTLTKKNTGALVLSGANTFTGDFNQLAGEVDINSAGALGSGGWLVNGGTFDNTSGAAVTTTATNTQRWNVAPVFNGTNALTLGATSVVLPANSTITVNGTAPLSYGGPVTGAFTLNKAGSGSLVLLGTNTYTSPTTVSAGSLTVAVAPAAPHSYVVAPGASFYLGYGMLQSGNLGVTVNGAGVSSTGGLYMNGGTVTTIEGSGGLILSTAPSTVRTYGTGAAVLQGYDSNGYCLTVNTAASGSVIASTVNFVHGQFGYRMSIPAGANTATGDVIMAGKFTGAGSSQQTYNGIGTNFYKWGSGSMLLTNTSTATTGLWIEAGTLLIGVDNAWNPLSNGIVLGDTAATAKMVLGGHAQTLKDLTFNGLGGSVVGGSATPSVLTLNYAGTGRTLGGLLGGTGSNENNLSLVKSGAGPLTLTANNTYTGNTSVTAGTLVLTQPYLADGSDVYLASGATLQLDTAATDTVHGFYIDGVQQVAGIWGSPTSGAAHTSALITGAGKLNVTTGPAGYSSWAAINAGGQAANLDYDHDGVPNGVEYFMGATGSSFTANPAPVNGTITWPKDPTAVITGYAVQTSPDLVTWTTATGVVDNGTSVSYTLPTGSGKLFVRLLVTTP